MKENFGQAPELIVGGQWFNGNPLSLDELRGKVVLIDFWTYTCINCQRTLPYLRSWDEKYRENGLVIIGVHTPEFEFEKKVDNVARAIKDFNLKYPVMQDNDFVTWRVYRNRYWPAKYLIDKDGFIRYTHFGEGAYNETEKMIQKLLEEGGVKINEQVDNPSYAIDAQTPELYVGTARFQRGSINFMGKWDAGEEYRSPLRGSSLRLKFTAKKVFLVVRPKNPGTQIPFTVRLDGSSIPPVWQGKDVNKNTSKIIVDTDRLFELIKLPKAHMLDLILEFPSEGLELYAFTFG